MNENRYGYESRCYEGAPAFERYDPAQCPQRPYGWEEERYHDPHLPTPMKTDQSEQETPTGPIYPRYVPACILRYRCFIYVVNETPSPVNSRSFQTNNHLTITKTKCK